MPRQSATVIPLLALVKDMPWISAVEALAFVDFSRKSVYSALGTLEEQGLVHGVVAGASVRPARRYRLTRSGAARFLEPQTHFHLTRPLSALSAMLPVVEALYRHVHPLMSRTNAGKFRSFRWWLRDGVDAFVSYDAGTFALLWSGYWHGPGHLGRRLEALNDLAERVDDWPALICVVAVDYWQACRAYNEGVAFGMGEGFTVYCVETGAWFGDPAWVDYGVSMRLPTLLAHSRHRVPADLPPGFMGSREGSYGALRTQILDWVEQFPGTRASTVSAALSAEHSRVASALGALERDGWLVPVEGHYYLGNPALAQAAKRDRVAKSRPMTRFGVRGGRPAMVRYRNHDAEAARISGKFRHAGHPVAGGWRGDDYLGVFDAVVPDAMIYVGGGSTGGEGWLYLEYERRAASTVNVENKLRGYLSRAQSRGETRPLLVVARNDTMVRAFLRQAQAASYPLWATTVAGARSAYRDGLLGRNTVWVDADGQRADWLPPSF